MLEKTIKVVGTVALHKFLLEVEQALLDGWRVHSDAGSCPKPYLARRNGHHTYSVTLVKEGEVEPEAPVITEETFAVLNKITKKKDLLVFGESMRIDVSGDEYQKGVPKKISSMLKAALLEKSGIVLEAEEKSTEEQLDLPLEPPEENNSTEE